MKKSYRKAYYVFDPDDATLGDVIKAESPGLAKTHSGIACFVGNPIVDLRVRRLPYLDDKPLTLENQLVAGIVYLCNKCHSELDDPKAIVEFGFYLYCQECGKQLLDETNKLGQRWLDNHTVNPG